MSYPPPTRSAAIGFWPGIWPFLTIAKFSLVTPPGSIAPYNRPRASWTWDEVVRTTLHVSGPRMKTDDCLWAQGQVMSDRYAANS